MKKHIPNFITLLNLLSGCIAIVLSFDGNLILASYLIGLAAFFDFFDGMAARLLNSKSSIGKELDSLADVVSFGVVPGVIIYSLLKHNFDTPSIDFYSYNLIPFIGFMIPLFSALRLAKFNIDERQTESFIGLPTPANAILIASIPLILDQTHSLSGIDLQPISGIISNSYFLIAITLLLSYLLIAELPLMSLKFSSFNWSENKWRFLLLGISFILIILFSFAAIPFIMLLYILISVFQKSKF